MSIITDKVAQCPTCHQAKHLLNMLSGSEQCEAMRSMINDSDNYQLDNGTLKKKSGDEWLTVGKVSGSNCGELSSLYVDDMGSHIYFIKDNGKLYNINIDDYGNIGGTIEVPNMTNIKDIFTSYFATFILKNDGTLWSKGMNGNGQLGVGDTTDRDEFTEVIMPQGLTITGDDVVDIEMIYLTSFYMVINKKNIYGVGDNQYGQMGTGDTNNVNVFTKIDYGDDVKEFYFTKYHIYHMSHVPISIFVLKNDGTLWGHGDNNYGQLGIGDTDDALSPIQIPNINDVKKVYNNGKSAFIIKNDGSVWCAGRNGNGELGVGNFNHAIHNFTNINVTDVKDMVIFTHRFASALLTNDGKLYVTGYNPYGELGLGDTDDKNTWTDSGLSNVDKITTIDIYCNLIAILANGDVYTSGPNDHGQLGTGDEVERHSFVLINTPAQIKNFYSFYYNAYVGIDNDLYVTGVEELEYTKTAHDFNSSDISFIIMRNRIALFKLKNGEYYVFSLIKNETASIGKLNVEDVIVGDVYNIDLEL